MVLQILPLPWKMHTVNSWEKHCPRMLQIVFPLQCRKLHLTAMPSTARLLLSRPVSSLPHCIPQGRSRAPSSRALSCPQSQLQWGPRPVTQIMPSCQLQCQIPVLSRGQHSCSHESWHWRSARVPRRVVTHTRTRCWRL